MPQYDWDQFLALLTEAEKRRILAMFCFATAPLSCDWEKVATATRSASAASAHNLHTNMIRKLRGAVLKATKGNGETSAAVANETPDTTPIAPKIPKTPKKSFKRKTEDETEDETEDPKPNKFRKLDSTLLTRFDRDLMSSMRKEE
ncbi:hypothetical protein W97_07139 [Coniosporium apollinis CBS 100218]|uniref:Uncharacterized protein n=1 Tax=Coniosporium apollinis (strain CBS 100218) TaxID=1168221 RepID=R7Z1M5_CONA1|nr:uncharacterized protein W97_07139 [Coniosporium apollinis CBS 100218]EON67993.1 hypothetical protein W97_07139 [Coniosporium apollinis CBS 100218]